MSLRFLMGALSLAALSARAGDAVAIGLNPAGVWTAVTYYCSPTPKGGEDYKDESQAREAAARDLRRRDGENPARTEILSSSDTTGFVAIVRGKTVSGRGLIVVGRGKSEAEAETKARAGLNRQGATAKQRVLYRYFSHGAESAAKP